MLQSNYSIRNTVSRKGEVIVLYDINIFINKSLCTSVNKPGVIMQKDGK